MPRPRSLKPAYCLHRKSGRAYVTIDGKQTYLGPHGSQASRDEYDRLVGEWIARGRPRAAPDARARGGVTVAQVIVAFWAHAKSAYPAPPFKEGKRPKGELGNYWDALRPLRRLYGPTPAAEFGSRALKAVREEMVRLGWCRNVVNRNTSRLKRAFRWAAEEELVPAEVAAKVWVVRGLAAGRTEARETEPVRPAPEAYVEAILPHLSRQLRAMAQLEVLTGMRPGEVCSMRSGEVDTSGRLWVYKPARHKTAHHGHERRVQIGPQARAVLEPLLKPDLQAYVFSPAEAEAERRAALHAARTTPASCGNTPGSCNAEEPRRRPGVCYTVSAYRRAVQRACAAAFPPPAHLARRRVPARGRKRNATRLESLAEWRDRLGPDQWEELQRFLRDHRWSPNQLRHTCATIAEREFSLEHAQAVLGHRTPKVTRTYAAGQAAKAEQVASRIG